MKDFIKSFKTDILYKTEKINYRELLPWEKTKIEEERFDKDEIDFGQ